MAKNLDVLVEAHRVAGERRKAGKPVWDERLNVYHTEGMTFEERRDAFVQALERTRWFKRQEHGDELHELWDEIKDAEDEGHFNAVLAAIYDEADIDRVWIQFHKPLQSAQ